MKRKFIAECPDCQKGKLTPYQRIMVAANKGVGLRLSAREVAAMSADSAISMLADNDYHSQKQKVSKKGEM